MQARETRELTGGVCPSSTVHKLEHSLAPSISHQQMGRGPVSSSVATALAAEVLMASLPAIAVVIGVVAQMQRMSSRDKSPPCRFPRHR